MDKIRFEDDRSGCRQPENKFVEIHNTVLQDRRLKVDEISKIA